MKRALLAFCVLALVAMLFGTSASAQNAYNVNDKVISAGLALGGFSWFYGTTDFPPVFVAFETGLPLAELKNKLTIGGIVGYSASSEEWSWGKWSYSYIVIAATGNYHFLETSKNLDAYAGIGLGYTIVSSSYTSKAGYENYNWNWSAGGSYFGYDFHVGARYYFTPKLAVMGELGYGFGIFRVGISYKI